MTLYGDMPSIKNIYKMKPELATRDQCHWSYHLLLLNSKIGGPSNTCITSSLPTITPFARCSLNDALFLDSLSSL